MFDSVSSSGASIGDGQSAVASNIANTTYRLQWWDFTKFDLPEISNGTTELHFSLLLFIQHVVDFKRLLILRLFL